eukprot:gnl/MRDRNA2_/MRDRNA2_115746_c0_seq1.p1 gnl/MRDRNA2_/MRDRNA2_115746_c0~~gnl/MRDRNA2_/MRDRNA2_115746_c0_seq1.p1  ORF type:complete len:240 (+),score=38.92 gnl/MRDRNA2_/MRDRNA2_115746_c0_seq1:78-797(+)
MTDRFYPSGLLTNEADTFKSTYTIQNEMRSFARSSYPTGYGGHEPGSRFKFGYANPAPDASILANPEGQLTENVGSPHGRSFQTMTRSSNPDDRVTFQNYDRHQWDQQLFAATTNQLKKTPMTQSLPELSKTCPAELKRRHLPVTNLEDDLFSYFVPKGLQTLRREKLLERHLPKLVKKGERISPSISGEGTGFRTQGGGGANWWPVHNGAVQMSSTKDAFRPPPFRRTHGGGFLAHSF